jgi:hypothetical protein
VCTDTEYDPLDQKSDLAECCAWEKVLRSDTVSEGGDGLAAAKPGAAGPAGLHQLTPAQTLGGRSATGDQFHQG